MNPNSSSSSGSSFPGSTFPAAKAPDRTRTVEAYGVRLAVYEWGDAHAKPVLLAHGGFDFARTFDVFAPLLAAGGYRIVSWDHRGHGDSEHAELYSWQADERDLLAVANSVSPGPFPVVGHSKGGAMLLHIIQSLPHRFSKFAAIDGLPFRQQLPDVANRERTTKMKEKVLDWLDHERKAHEMIRKPGTSEELAKRRARMNPRLTHEWLHYLVFQGAKQADDGWRWKIDPALKMGGFGPWRARWATDRLPGLSIPLLALFGTENEPMGWGADPEGLRRYMPPRSRIEVLKDVGHFLHIEQPQQCADLILAFLDERVDGRKGEKL